MTAAGDLVRLEVANQIAAAEAFLCTAPELERFGVAFEVVGGVACASCAAWDHPLFNRALGAGILAPLDRVVLEAIVRWYAARGRPAYVDVYDGITPGETVRLLEASGFAPSEHAFEAHVLEATAAPPASPTAAVRRCEPDEHERFAALVRDGFGVSGVVGELFVACTLASLRRLGAAGAAFIAALDGEDAGTGQLACSERVAGCYSGSVLPRVRGKGVQRALIAARIDEGLRRGRSIFVSQTEPDGPSAHNLHDLGFRPLYRATHYVRA